MAATAANVHATCVVLAKAAVPFGARATAGILLLGRSGSGKSDLALRLIALGAKQCISTKDLYWGRRPLETSKWAGAIDNVGGDMLAGLTRVIHPYGNIASCGNAAAIELQP